MYGGCQKAAPRPRIRTFPVPLKSSLWPPKSILSPKLPRFCSSPQTCFAVPELGWDGLRPLPPLRLVLPLCPTLDQSTGPGALLFPVPRDWCGCAVADLPAPLTGGDAGCFWFGVRTRKAAVNVPVGDLVAVSPPFSRLHPRSGLPRPRERHGLSARRRCRALRRSGSERAHTHLPAWGSRPRWYGHFKNALRSGGCVVHSWRFRWNFSDDS